MKPTLALFFAFLLANFSFGQDSALQLKEYKFRTPVFRALTVQLNSAGTYSKTASGSSVLNEDKHVSLLPSTISYYKISSTDRRLLESSVTLQPRYLYLSGSEGRKGKTNSFSAVANWLRNDRFYKNKLWFFELGNQLSINGNRNRDRDTANRSGFNGQGFGNRLSLGFGRGRIERVQDAQMALFILNDLAAQGLLARPVDKETAYRFAQLITDVNNRRVFDFRRRRIYELTRIDSFLRNSGLAPTTDIRHFATVNDNWAFAVNAFRQAGSSWFVRLQPSIGYNEFKSRNRRIGFDETLNANAVSLALSPVIGFERYVPKGLKWQHNSGASLAYETAKQSFIHTRVANGVSDRNDFDGHSKAWTLRGFYGLGFFPNNRTQVQASVELLASRIREQRPDNTLYELNPVLNFSAGYFLGYRTFLNANFYASGAVQPNKVFFVLGRWAKGSFVEWFTRVFSRYFLTSGWGSC